MAFYTIKANGIQTYYNNEYNSVPVIEIARIAVQYEFQNNGIGKKLFYDYIMPRIKDVERLIAIKAIIVFVEQENEQGVKFYKSIGFEKADPIVQNSIYESFNEECDLYVLSMEKIL